MSSLSEPTEWDLFWMSTAAHFANKSKDRRRKVGCVIVDEDNGLLSQGWNGFPRGVNDDIDSRHEVPEKYLWTKHAEENAVSNAARNGVALKGSTIYVPWFPCANCAGDIIQAGITRLVAYVPDWSDPKWGSNMVFAKTMLDERKVEIRFIPGLPPQSSVS